jgi:hypothetical protein
MNEFTPSEKDTSMPDKTPKAFYADLKHSEPITQLTVALFLDAWIEAVQTVLKKHGCSMQVNEQEDSCIITFPEGTTRSETLPRTKNCRFTIHLADGTEFIQIQERSGVSYLGFSKTDLP